MSLIIMRSGIAKYRFAAAQNKSDALNGTRIQIQKGSGYLLPRQMWFNYYRQVM